MGRLGKASLFPSVSSSTFSKTSADQDRLAYSGRRTYTLYIMYSPYYRTPRLYMSGYLPNGQPLPPHMMMEDIVGDYKDKTVTLEDFPFFANNVKMASVHPCKHASVMKTMLDRADAALRIRREKLRTGALAPGSAEQGMEGLVEEIDKLDVSGVDAAAAAASADKSGDEWEEVQHEPDDQEVAIRVDQYLVVFLKVRPSPIVTLSCYSSPETLTGLRTVYRERDSRYRA